MFLDHQKIYLQGYNSIKCIISTKYINFYQYPSLIFLGHTYFVFVDKVVINIFVYLFIMNSSLYENIVDLFEHDMEKQTLVKLIKQPLENVLVFSGRH